MSIAQQLRRAAAGVSAGEFNPETDITWHSLFWAEGTDFQAQGYSDTNDVGTWPNETGESNATEATNEPTYDAANAAYNGQPTVHFPADTSKLMTANFSSNPTYPISIVLIGNMGAVPPTRFDHFFDGNDASRRNLIGLNTSPAKWSIAGVNVVNSAIAPDNDPHLFVGHYDGSTGNESLDLDGTQIAVGAGGAHQLDGLTIGALYIGSYSCKGDIALLGIYEGDITADDSWAAMVAWIEDHYGLSIA